MTDGITERPSIELRWRRLGWRRVLEQKWVIRNLTHDARWDLKEEWRPVPVVKNDD